MMNALALPRSTDFLNAIYQPPPVIKKHPSANYFLKIFFVTGSIINENRSFIGLSVFAVTERLI